MRVGAYRHSPHRHRQAGQVRRCCGLARQHRRRLRIRTTRRVRAIQHQACRPQLRIGQVGQQRRPGHVPRHACIPPRRFAQRHQWRRAHQPQPRLRAVVRQRWQLHRKVPLLPLQRRRHAGRHGGGVARHRARCRWRRLDFNGAHRDSQPGRRGAANRLRHRHLDTLSLKPGRRSTQT